MSVNRGSLVRPPREVQDLEWITQFTGNVINGEEYKDPLFYSRAERLRSPATAPTPSRARTRAAALDLTGACPVAIRSGT